MDSIDIRILGTLQERGRATYQEIGDAVGLSPPSVLNRVRRLEQSGIITGFGARVDAECCGYPVLAFVWIELGPEANDQALIGRWESAAECEACYRIALTGALLLRLRLPSMEELDLHLREIRKAGCEARAELVLRSEFERDFTPKVVRATSHSPPQSRLISR